MSAEKHIYDRLMEVFSEAGTVAIMGNWFAESGFNSNNLQNSFNKKLGMTDEEYTKAVNDGSYNNFIHDGAGYGLAQWTFWSRKQGLLNYANGIGRSIDDLDMQIDYALIELGRKSSLYKLLRESTDYALCTVEVLTKYERPADQGEAEQKKRIGYAEELYRKYVEQEEKEVTNKPRVFIGVGHGGSDPGAVGYVREEDVNLTMALACKDELVANGVEVLMSRTKDENDPVAEEVNECNAFNPDLAADVHNNAGGGDGFEAIVSIVGGLGTTLAKNIEAEVKKLGQNSRGIKTRKNSNGKDYYAFNRSTKCPAVILEGAFVDNATDVKAIDTVAEQKEFGRAYARGILKTLNDMGKLNNIKEEVKEEPKEETNPNTLYRVQIGAYGNKANAENMQKKLKTAGFDAVIVKN